MKHTTRRILAIIGLMAGIGFGLAAEAAKAAPGQAARTDYSLMACHQYIPYYEQALRIPSRLLESIALTESSRSYPGTKMTIAWPWTVMAEGRGRYFNSRTEAIAEVQSLKKRGIRNIDVGCMQVNLRAHPEAFDNLEQAFDPAYNVRYAAEFLTRLRNQHSSWVKAVGFYHSGTPDLHKRYRDKVLAKWRTNFQKSNQTSVAAAYYSQQPATPVTYNNATTTANGMTAQQVYQQWYASRAAGRPVATTVGQGGKVFYVNQQGGNTTSVSQRSQLAAIQQARQQQFLTQRRNGRMQVYEYR